MTAAPSVAQADGPPCNGRYPTTAWAAGEKLQDAHPLVLPPNLEPGEYHLLVGLYDAESMARLGLVDGTDLVRLESTIVVR